MLNQNPFSSQDTIPLFFFLRQRMVFGFLERRLAVFMNVCQALIASICQNPNAFCNLASILLEKLEVVFTPIGKGSRNDFSALWVCHQLRFLGMALLFAAVMPFLAFFGRSIGCSLTSTNTTSKTVSLGCNAFLPGRRNFPERTSVSSTFRMVRHTVDSLMP